MLSGAQDTKNTVGACEITPSWNFVRTTCLHVQVLAVFWLFRLVVEKAGFRNGDERRIVHRNVVPAEETLSFFQEPPALGMSFHPKGVSLHPLLSTARYSGVRAGRGVRCCFRQFHRVCSRQQKSPSPQQQAARNP